MRLLYGSYNYSHIFSAFYIVKNILFAQGYLGSHCGDLSGLTLYPTNFEQVTVCYFVWCVGSTPTNFYCTMVLGYFATDILGNQMLCGILEF